MKQGSINLTPNAGAAISNANNGLSVLAGAVQLGEAAAGSAGAGVFTSNRFINPGAFKLQIVLPAGGGYGARNFTSNGGTPGFCFSDEFGSTTGNPGQLLALRMGGGVNTTMAVGIDIDHLDAQGDFIGINIKNRSIVAGARSVINIANQSASKLELGMSNTGGAYPLTGQILTTGAGGLNFHAAQHASAEMGFFTGADAYGTERMKITQAGNILFLKDPTLTKGQTVQPLGRIASGEIVSYADLGDQLSGSATTTDAATPVTLLEITPPANSSRTYLMQVVCRDTVSGDTKVFTYYSMCKNVAGVVSLVGAGLTAITSTSEAAVVGATLSTSIVAGVQRISANGVAAKTLIWELIAMGRAAVNPAV